MPLQLLDFSPAALYPIRRLLAIGSFSSKLSDFCSDSNSTESSSKLWYLKWPHASLSVPSLLLVHGYCLKVFFALFDKYTFI